MFYLNRSMDAKQYCALALFSHVSENFAGLY